jgi:hypothetical protein
MEIMNRTACGFNPLETTYDRVIKIIRGSYYGNDEEGLLVRLSDKVTIDGAGNFGNMRQSVRIEGAIYIIAKNSTIRDNGQAATALLAKT